MHARQYVFMYTHARTHARTHTHTKNTHANPSDFAPYTYGTKEETCTCIPNERYLTSKTDARA
jgi:hypothetical protein